MRVHGRHGHKCARAMFEAEFSREIALGKWRGALVKVRGA